MFGEFIPCYFLTIGKDTDDGVVVILHTVMNALKDEGVFILFLNNGDEDKALAFAVVADVNPWKIQRPVEG